MHLEIQEILLLYPNILDERDTRIKLNVEYWGSGSGLFLETAARDKKCQILPLNFQRHVISALKYASDFYGFPDFPFIIQPQISTRL
jgi:hypothetical protein